jgi:hypothetical protein
MRHYCTLTDIDYLPRLLTMHQSLLTHSSEDCTLWILVMDKASAGALMRLQLPEIRMIAIEELEETLELQELRTRRSWKNYCWAMSSQLTWFLLRSGLDEITYLDADMFFFADPKPVFEWMGERSIGITPHRLIPEKRYLSANGEFNLGWLTLRHTPVGYYCSDLWAQQVRQRSAKNPRYFDQQYLDVWPFLYGEAVAILPKNVNVAPWNVGNWEVTAGPAVDGMPIIVYHFHEFSDQGDGRFRLTNYALRDADREYIYKPYLKAYAEARDRLLQLEGLMR